MPQLEVYVTDYTGDWLYALPEAEVTEVVETLNDVGTCTFKVPNQLTMAGGAKTNIDQIDGLSREIQVREILPDGTSEIVFQGPPVSEEGGLATCTFQCEGVLTHFNDRIIDTASLIYTSIEQRTIGWNLIAYAQSEASQANRNFNVTSAVFSGTTHVRSKEYRRDDHAVILDLLKEFPKLDDGFDFSIEVQPDGSRLWTPWYPRKGSLKSELMLEYAPDGERSLTKMTYKRDWKRLRTHIYATGGSNGNIKFENNYEDTAASSIYKVRQGTISEGSERDVGWLLARATREVELRKNPIFVPEITTVRVPRDMRRLVTVGDYVPMKIDAGRVQISTQRRILEKKWTPRTDEVFLTVSEDTEVGGTYGTFGLRYGDFGGVTSDYGGFG